MKTRYVPQGLLVVVLAGGCSISRVDHNGGELRSRIDGVVEEAMGRDRLVGVSIGVKNKGEILVAKGYGYADLENRVKATEHTVYRIGSITKQFTAAAVLMLVEQGAINLDDDLTKFFPDYPTGGHRVTIDHLLHHTSGIKGYTEMEKFWGLSRLDLSHEDMIDMFSAEPFEFAPGERYQYSNSGYYLLGVIIERVSKKSYAEFLKEYIFDPLGLDETHYLDNAPIVRNRAEGYELAGGDVVNDEPLSMKTPFSAGALGSSVVDLIAWQEALSGQRVVSEERYRRMISPATLNDGSATTYGYGLAIGAMEGHPKISHGGGINGFVTQLAYYPDDDLTVVVLCNLGSARPDVLESRIARTVLGVPEKTVELVPLGEEDLEKYVGLYDAGRSPIEVSMEGGTLAAMGRRLRPIGDHRFLPEGDDYRVITFIVEGGRVAGLRIEREGQVTKANRIQ